jgi:hypothetical protein
VISESHAALHRRVDLDSRALSEETIERLRAEIEELPESECPAFAPDAIYPSSLASLRLLSRDLKAFFARQWQAVEEN